MCSALLILGFGALAARVGQLQIADGGHYKQLSVKLALHTIPLTAERGSVFDRNGRDLAMSIERTTVYADPTLVTDAAGEAATLAPLLRVAESTLVQRLSDKGPASSPRRFVYLAHTVPDAVAVAVKAKKLAGIGFVPESARSYPAGTVAAAVIGQVHSDGSGAAGIEQQYNSLLTGKSGALTVEQDPLGHDIPDTQKTQVDAQRGTDVVLSIDEDLQWQAEYSLLDQVKATGAKSGMAVVVDVTNGDVLAMANVNGASGATARPRRAVGRGQHAAHRSLRARIDQQAHHALVGARARAHHTRVEIPRAQLVLARLATSSRTTTRSRTRACRAGSSTGRRPTSCGSRRTSGR